MTFGEAVMFWIAKKAGELLIGLALLLFAVVIVIIRSGRDK